MPLYLCAVKSTADLKTGVDLHRYPSAQNRSLVYSIILKKNLVFITSYTVILYIQNYIWETR